MKTKLALILSIVALSTLSYAGPSDGAAFAMRHAQEVANQENAAANRIALVRSTEGQQGQKQCCAPRNTSSCCSKR